MVLLTLCLELNYLRRNDTTLSAGMRVAPVLTAMMLTVSITLAFSMTAKADMPNCGLAAVWHEYVCFVFTSQSMAIGLTTLVWLLVKDSFEA